MPQDQPHRPLPFAISCIQGPVIGLIFEVVPAGSGGHLWAEPGKANQVKSMFARMRQHGQNGSHGEVVPVAPAEVLEQGIAIMGSDSWWPRAATIARGRRV